MTLIFQLTKIMMMATRVLVSIRHVGQIIQEWTSKICGRQSLKNLKGYGLLKQAISLEIF